MNILKKVKSIVLFLYKEFFWNFEKFWNIFEKADTLKVIGHISDNLYHSLNYTIDMN